MAEVTDLGSRPGKSRASEVFVRLDGKKGEAKEERPCGPGSDIGISFRGDASTFGTKLCERE